jgi:hypothetical protein
MTDETRETEGSDRMDETAEGAREQGVRTEHPEDLSSPQMTSPVADDESRIPDDSDGEETSDA